MLWIGPVQWDGPAAPLYACEPCIQRLTAKARAYFVAKRPVPVSRLPPPVVPRPVARPGRGSQPKTLAYLHPREDP